MGICCCRSSKVGGRKITSKINSRSSGHPRRQKKCLEIQAKQEHESKPGQDPLEITEIKNCDVKHLKSIRKKIDMMIKFSEFYCRNDRIGTTKFRKKEPQFVKEEQKSGHLFNKDINGYLQKWTWRTRTTRGKKTKEGICRYKKKSRNIFHRYLPKKRPEAQPVVDDNLKSDSRMPSLKSPRFNSPRNSQKKLFMDDGRKRRLTTFESLDIKNTYFGVKGRMASCNNMQRI